MNLSPTFEPFTDQNVSVFCTPGSKKKTKRVFHLINGEHYSGAERVQDLLSSALPQFGYKVDFGCIKPDRFAKAIKNQSAPIHNFEMRNRFDFSVVKKMMPLVSEINASLIHAHTPRALMIGATLAKRTGLPLVYHVHSPVGKDSKRRLQNWVNSKIESHSIRRVTKLICVSENIQRYMTELGHPEEKIAMVPNGVQVVHDLAQRARPETPWTIGTVALFRPRKGTEILLKALAILKSKRIAVRVLAVGPFESSDYENQIRSLAEQLGVGDLIEWTGFTQDVNSFFSKMDAFVLPSLFGEGLPMVVLESMANGTPVIATDVEGIRQAIRDSQDGLVCKPNNPEDLASKIEAMTNGEYDWESLRKSALQRQRNQFSDESMARGVAKIYDSILE